MMMLMVILYFFTICEYAILVEIVIESSIGLPAGKDNNEGHTHINLPLPQMDFKVNPELAKIFELYDLIAIRGPKLFAHPAIVDEPEEVLKSPNIIDELPFHERMSNFARDIQEFLIQKVNASGTERELTQEEKKRFKGENMRGTERELTPEEKKRFIKIKYPNTALLLLICAIKNVDTQNEIQNDLNIIWAKENADELRFRQKYLFKFGFIMDCIYAYYMDDKQKINFHKIRLMTITKVIKIEQHPFYTILMENKCASQNEIRIFVNMFLSIPGIEEKSGSIQHFFNYHMKDPFVNEITNERKINGKLEQQEYIQLRDDPYFPEKLPKIFNLFALLEDLSEIIVQIVEQIKPIGYENHQTNLMREILLRIKINFFNGGKVLISKHYKKAANKIPNEKLRTNMGAISENDTIFYNIFKNDIKYQYKVWYNRLKFHMLKYLAEKYFGISDLLEEEDENKMISRIKIKICKNILQKTLSQIRERNNTIMEMEKKQNELLAQLHLRIFCVGIRQMDSSKRIFLERYHYRKSIFHVNMVSELLEIVPGAMEKFNEIIAPKEKLLENNEHQKMNFFFEAVSEIRSKICEKQQNDEKHEVPNKTILSP